MNIGHISGGTHAGWKKVKQAAKGWYCLCDGEYRKRPGYLVRCPDCGDTRPS